MVCYSISYSMIALVFMLRNGGDYNYGLMILTTGT